VRGWSIVAATLLAACQSGVDDSPAPPVKLSEPDVKAASQEPLPSLSIPLSPPILKPSAWTFAVMSDLHLPNYKLATVNKTVAALVAMHPRLVVITGDFTNGGALDGPLRAHAAARWWNTITTALLPLRKAGISVLPVAGNHDSYLSWHREGYASAFADLDKWAAPLVVKSRPAAGLSVASAPFSYGVDVDDYHFALTHIVAQHLERDVATWLIEDLAAASGAKHRILFGHVPMSSVIQPPSKTFIAKLGAILEAAHVEMYIAGHEHIVWDENVRLPAGAVLRQIIVGCTSGFYDFAPNDASKKRANCQATTSRVGMREPVRCKMPNGGGEFMLSRGRKNRQIQHYKNSFTMFTVDGDKISARPMTVDDSGRILPFYLKE